MVMHVVAFWMVLSVLFLGLGVLASHILRFPLKLSTFIPWMGWALGIIILQVWHLFLPVDGRALVCLAVFGGIGIIIGHKEISRAISIKLCLVWGPVILLCALWLAGHTVNQVVNSDSGLYHLNSVRWAKEYAIVPGLGNLHERLAFNQSYFLYVALLDIGTFSHKSHQLASGLLILWTLLRSLSAFSMLVSRGGVMVPRVLFDALMLVPCFCYIIYSGNATSPTPDAGIFFLGLLVASELLGLFSFTSAEKEGSGDIISHAIPIVVLAVVGITVKLSFALTALVVITLLLHEGIRKSSRQVRIKLCIATLLCMMAVMIPWTIRGVILSGYPAFPCALGALPVEWRLPVEKAHESSGGVRMWAWTKAERIPVEYLGTAKGLWLNLMYMTRHDQSRVIVPLVLALAGGLCGVWLRAKWKMVGIIDFKIKYFLVPLLALIYWLVMAPTPKFAGAAFWMIGGGAVTWALVCLERKCAAICVIFISVLLFAEEIVLPEFIKPWERDAGPAKTAALVERVTDSGLRVYMAKAADGRPWDSPLPAIDPPCWHPGLRLRVPGNMAKGFRVDRK